MSRPIGVVSLLYNAGNGVHKKRGSDEPRFCIERVMGIEPTYPAWKAGALADVLHPHLFNYYLVLIEDTW